MPIISSSDTYLRPQVFAYLKKLKSSNPGLTVLDVGGAFNPWCDEYVTTYIDLYPVETKKEVVRGNILDHDFWQTLSGRRWDFVICTHVLEDLRDPLFVIRWLQRVASSGFVAVPNKHTEVSAVESPQYPGYFHHRWIFVLQGQVLRAVAKLALLGYYRKANRWLHRMHSSGKFLKLIALRLFPDTIPGGGMISWYDANKAKHGLELGFIWEKEFEFEYLDDDLTGPDPDTMAKRYLEGLAEGL